MQLLVRTQFSLALLRLRNAQLRLTEEISSPVHFQ
jgi:hypothetical protein